MDRCAWGQPGEPSPKLLRPERERSSVTPSPRTTQVLQDLPDAGGRRVWKRQRGSRRLWQKVLVAGASAVAIKWVRSGRLWGVFSKNCNCGKTHITKFTIFTLSVQSSGINTSVEQASPPSTELFAPGKPETLPLNTNSPFLSPSPYFLPMNLTALGTLRTWNQPSVISSSFIHVVVRQISFFFKAE